MLIEIDNWNGSWHGGFVSIVTRCRTANTPTEYIGKTGRVVMSFALKNNGAQDETTRAGGDIYLEGNTKGQWKYTNNTPQLVPIWTHIGAETNQKPFGFNKVRDTSTFMTTAGWNFTRSLQPSIENTAWLRSESVVLADTVGASYFYDAGAKGPNDVRIYIEVGE